MLKPCPHFHGGTAVIDADPACRVARDALWLPTPLAGAGRGLFDAAGRAIPEALAFRGIPEPHTPLGATWTANTGADLPRAPRGLHYVHLGQVNRHFGHFLIGAVARLWALGIAPTPDLRLVMDEAFDAETLFATPHARAIFTALGLAPHHFVRFPEGCVFDEITVPAMAFEENSHVHRSFGRLMARLGNILGPRDIPAAPLPKIVYLTKQHLPSGIWRLHNEAALADALARRGAMVVAPEQLSLPAQIGLWQHARASGTTLIATTGSALHTAAFVPHSRVIAINDVAEMWTNQVLIDRVSNSRATYLHAPDMRALGPDGHFLATCALPDIEAAADTLCTLAGSRNTPPQRPLPATPFAIT